MPSRHDHFIDFSYTPRPKPGGREGWEAAGWIWLFDTSNDRNRFRVVRLQNIMGCANVSSGPSMSRQGYGVWIRPVEYWDGPRHLPGRHCYCEIAPLEPLPATFYRVAYSYPSGPHRSFWERDFWTNDRGEIAREIQRQQGVNPTIKLVEAYSTRDKVRIDA